MESSLITNKLFKLCVATIMAASSLFVNTTALAQTQDGRVTIYLARHDNLNESDDF